MQAVDSWAFLGLAYYLLESSPGPAGSEEEISLCAALTPAETLAGPLCFAHLQLRWLQRLKDDLHKVSRHQLDLTLAQLTALRAPHGQLLQLSVQCWRDECASKPSTRVKRCKRCKRVWYCGEACSTMSALLCLAKCLRLTILHRDWEAGHKKVCRILANVAAALEERRAELEPYFVTM